MYATRRSVLKSAGAMAIAAGAGTLTNTLLTFPGRAADASGYKALVCVFFKGGLDCHDVLLPFDQTSYTRYAEIRQALMAGYAAQNGGSSRVLNRLLPLSPANADAFGSRRFALAQEMEPIHSLFESGVASIIANVGPLVAPITREQYRARTVQTPRRLFSHNDQQSTWMSLQPEGVQYGWGGRFADAMLSAQANANSIYTAITVTGNEVFLSGETARQYQIDSSGIPASIRELSDTRLLGSGSRSTVAQTILREHFSAPAPAAQNLFERDIVASTARAISANDQFAAARTGAPQLATVFPNTGLGRQLRTVAQTIALRDTLGMRRQVFIVSLGGFDTHSAQASSLPGRMAEFANAAAAFYEATEELGVDQNVTLFTASDFGRTLTINNDGTDHGWGAHHFVIGGGLNGRRIFGDPAPYDLGHSQDAGNGRLIPTTPVEQYAATLGRWFGLNQAELNAALPLLPTFGNQGAVAFA